MAAIPIGALLGGLIAEHYNIRGPILAFGIISLIVSAAATIWTNDRIITAARRDADVADNDHRLTVNRLLSRMRYGAQASRW